MPCFAKSDLNGSVVVFFRDPNLGYLARASLNGGNTHKRPIFQETAAYGHFGRPNFSWERTDKAAVLRDAAGLGPMPKP